MSHMGGHLNLTLWLSPAHSRCHTMVKKKDHAINHVSSKPCITKKTKMHPLMHNHKHSFLSVQHKKTPKCAVCRKMTINRTFYMTLSKKAKCSNDDGVKSLSLCTSRFFFFFCFDISWPRPSPADAPSITMPVPFLPHLCCLSVFVSSSFCSECVKARLARAASVQRSQHLHLKPERPPPPRQHKEAWGWFLECRGISAVDENTFSESHSLVNVFQAQKFRY